MAAATEKPKATKQKKDSPPSSEPGTGDRIIEAAEKSAGTTALNRIEDTRKWVNQLDGTVGDHEARLKVLEEKMVALELLEQVSERTDPLYKREKRKAGR